MPYLFCNNILTPKSSFILEMDTNQPFVLLFKKKYLCNLHNTYVVTGILTFTFTMISLYDHNHGWRLLGFDVFQSRKKLDEKTLSINFELLMKKDWFLKIYIW